MKVEENEIGRGFRRHRWGQTIRPTSRDDDGSICGVPAEFREITPQKLQQSVTRVLEESATLRDAAAAILRAICKSMVWDFGAFWIMDRDAQILRCVETWYPPAARFAKLDDFSQRAPLSRGEGLSGHVWAHGRPVRIPGLIPVIHEFFTETAPPLNPMATEVGLRGAVGFPILLRGEVVGVLEFYYRQACRPRDTAPEGDLCLIVSREF